MHTCTCTYIHIYMYTYTYIHIHIYIYTHNYIHTRTDAVLFALRLFSLLLSVPRLSELICVTLLCVHVHLYVDVGAHVVIQTCEHMCLQLYVYSLDLMDTDRTLKNSYCKSRKSGVPANVECPRGKVSTETACAVLRFRVQDLGLGFTSAVTVKVAAPYHTPAPVLLFCYFFPPAKVQVDTPTRRTRAAQYPGA